MSSPIMKERWGERNERPEGSALPLCAAVSPRVVKSTIKHSGFQWPTQRETGHEDDAALLGCYLTDITLNVFDSSRSSPAQIHVF